MTFTFARIIIIICLRSPLRGPDEKGRERPHCGGTEDDMALFEVTPNDRLIWERELRDFLPEHIFDVHTHVYRKQDLKPRKPGARTVLWPSLVAEENPAEEIFRLYRNAMFGAARKILSDDGEAEDAVIHLRADNG